MTTQEGNKLIAEFMKLKPCLTDQKDEFGYMQCVDGFIRNDMEFPTDELRYHLKWGWLMPVVKKISAIGEEWPILTKPVWELTICVEIEVAWNKCIEVIHEINLNKIKH